MYRKRSSLSQNLIIDVMTINFSKITGLFLTHWLVDRTPSGTPFLYSERALVPGWWTFAWSVGWKTNTSRGAQETSMGHHGGHGFCDPRKKAAAASDMFRGFLLKI
jgi:hypothetical protein